MKSKNTTCGTF